jgi:DNA-binding transcriptional LysR family regulator
MQMKALKVFCDVVRFRSFSQAASANERSQSAVSQIVLALEKDLGTQLIDRSSRPLQLTELGKAVYERCQRIVDQWEELHGAVRTAQAEQIVNVRVAAIYSVGLRDMNQYLRRFAELQPRVKIHIEYLHPDRVYAEVYQGIADFGLVSFPRKSHPLVTIPWREEEMVLACSPRHPLAKNATVTPQQLNGQKYIGFDKGLVIRREVDRFLRSLDVTVIVEHEFDNIENIKKAVEIDGVALLPEPTLRREVEARTLVALPLAGRRLVRPLGIIHRRFFRPSPSAQRFLELLRQPDEPQQGGTATAAPQPAANRQHHRRNGRPRASSRNVS